jgi:hypothetical protein
MSEIYLLEFPGKQLTFELELESLPASQQETARSAVEGLELFCQDFVTPLSADLALSYCDTEFSFSVDEPAPEQPFWFLKSEAAPADAALTPAWLNSSEQSVPALTPQTILEWIVGTMAQNPPTFETANQTLVIGWTELLIRATRVRLPRSSDVATADSVELIYGADTIRYPIERIASESFVSGPLHPKSVTAPIDLRIESQTGVLKLTISMHWSLWTDPDQRGWSDIRDAVQRLQSHGWKCTYDGINLRAT